MLVGGTQEMQLTKLSGGWKYKEENVEESQQSCVIAGKVPTSYSSFKDVGTIRMRTQGQYAYSDDYTREFDGFDHEFTTEQGKVNKPGTSFSTKFQTMTWTKSSGHKYVTYGQFKGKIKNGEMTFQYAIPNGQASGMMVETGLYAQIQDERTQYWFRDVTRETFDNGTAQIIMQFGDEVFYGERNCGVKVGVSGGKAKGLYDTAALSGVGQ